MIYRKNVGTVEGWARILGGAALAVCAIALIGFTQQGMALAAGGVFGALTGAFGFCPACALIGRKPVEGPK
jgi:hypothetical protein